LCIRSFLILTFSIQLPWRITRFLIRVFCLVFLFLRALLPRLFFPKSAFFFVAKPPRCLFFPVYTRVLTVFSLLFSNPFTLEPSFPAVVRPLLEFAFEASPRPHPPDFFFSLLVYRHVSLPFFIAASLYTQCQTFFPLPLSSLLFLHRLLSSSVHAFYQPSKFFFLFSSPL